MKTLEIYKRIGAPLTPRSDAELGAFFAGFDLVPPGLVALQEWRPETIDGPDADLGGLQIIDELGGRQGDRLPGGIRTGFCAGVGRKP